MPSQAKGQRLPKEGEATLTTSRLLTIDIETVPVQGVGAQQGNAMGQLAQLPVQLLSVESQAFRVGAMRTHGIHSGGCPILLRPR